MTKYVHIGYPKNFSTSLQRDYFSKNSEIFHLGIGIGDNLKYRDDTVDKTFEVYLKTCKSFKYENRKQELIDHFASLYHKAQAQDYKAFGASSEHLSFAFTYDGLDTEVKVKRLFELFGAETKIVMIVRNQLDLIKSLFRESVRVGFKGDFSCYLDLLYRYQDRNYLSDLHFDWVLKKYSEVFGRENVFVLFFENYRRDNALVYNEQNQVKLFNDLDNILNVKSILSEFGHYNEALSKNQILSKIALNLKQSHDLGNHMYEAAEKHRLKNYFKNDLDLIEPDELTYSDVIIKRSLISEVQNESKEEKVNLFEFDPFIMGKLINELSESNRKLQRQLDINIPVEYFNMEARVDKSKPV